MSIATDSPPKILSLADVLDSLGGVPAQRILMSPAPGTATEADVLAMQHSGRLCELVDGILVEKPMGYEESLLAMYIGTALSNFVNPRKLGLVSGADGLMRLFPGLVRIPDVAFASWDRFPNRRRPRVPIPDLVPDLAVEVLSTSNTDAEMDRKLRDYFSSGVRLVWLVDPRTRQATVCTAVDSCHTIDVTQSLDGGNVLGGFELPLAELFAILDQDM